MKTADAHQAADHRAGTLCPKFYGLLPQPCLLPGAGHFFSASSPDCPTSCPTCPVVRKWGQECHPESWVGDTH